ncbi:MAG TPA: cupin domain-containing protein [Streptosporangiaceae bacterium]|nr:cupin domain-containing protein [Streptosporangiaceae bacterium]
MHIDQDSHGSVRGRADWFTGEVWMETLAQPGAASQVSIYRVHFTPGARTAWHSHPRGQTLHVTEGSGFVQSRGGEACPIRAGDTVWAEPGEWHWHGAGPGTLMAHFAVQEAVAGATAEWGDHVTSEYPG